MEPPGEGRILVGHPRFEEIRFLGKGAFGSVRLAREKVDIQGNAVDPPRLVAMKFLQRGPRTMTEYVTKEIVNHRRLCHPHVIQFREVFFTGNYLGMVLEYAPGGTLLEYINRNGGRLSEDSARWFFQQLIIGMDYCHRHKIVIRDIKLENTLLDRTDDNLDGLPAPMIKLVDFGLSEEEADQRSVADLVGTPSYMAPEVIQAVHAVPYDGRQADVWSSGVLLYAMITGRLPFGTVNALQPASIATMYKRILNVQYDDPGNVSEDCRNLLKRIFVHDPAERITVEGICNHPWFKMKLPGGAVAMNDKYGLNDQLLQTLEETTALVYAAVAPVPSIARFSIHEGAWADMEFYEDVDEDGNY